MPNENYSQLAASHIGVEQNLLQNEVKLSSILALLDSGVLDRLVETALANNPNLQQTQLRLQSAQLELSHANSDKLPNLNASVEGKNQEQQNNSVAGKLAVSWEIDVWRSIASNSQQQMLNKQMAELDLYAAKATLAANLIRSYLSMTANQQLLTLEQLKQTHLQTKYTLLKADYVRGLTDAEALDTLLVELAQTQVAVEQYHNSKATTASALAILLGQQPNNISEFNFPALLPSIRLPNKALEQQNLANRPDLRAAFLQIKQSEVNEKLAYKSLLPSFNLQASLTTQSDSLNSNLLTSGVWQLLSQLTAPIFRGGTLRKQLSQKQLDTQSSYWNYQQVLLNAAHEVQNSINNEQALQRQIQQLQQALRSQRALSQDITQQYKQGLSDATSLIDSQISQATLQQQLISLQLKQLSNRVDLGLSLGLGVS
ncbi:TolC family protein [Pseudoalteromonas sp. T1lg65]|uniref:TolC family protein n=1 Tax=Pseudoalteromonas sp. T1lg65 TaxID=2077101 RepID=UPI003F7AC60F